MTREREAAVPPKAGRREWTGLAVLSLACLLYSMDLTVLNLAVPDLSEDLRPSSAELLWIVDIYGFMVAGCLITMGTLGDRIGRRRLLLCGAAAFAAASVFAAFASSAPMLIAARALLGVAGATLAPSTLSLIRHMFLDDRERTKAIGLWVTAFSAGGALGPVFGGVMLELFWWGSVFLLGLPIMAALLIFGPRLLPEYKDPDAGRLDLGSAAMSLAAVLLVIYGLKRTAQDGLDPLAAAAMAAGAALGVAFVRRQAHLRDPLVDVGLFRSRAFSGPLALYTIGVLVMGGSFLFIGQYLQLVRGLSPLVAGLWMLPSMLGFIVGAMATQRLVARFPTGTVMGVGMLLGGIGLALLVRLDAGTSLALLVVASGITALGLAPVFTLATDLIVGGAPPERAGAASGISETGAEFGGAVGIAVLGSIGTAIYRGQMEDKLPAGLPREAADAARDTLGGAVGAVAQLPDAAGTALVDAGREAFTLALQLTSLTGAALAVAGAVLALGWLRGIRAPTGDGAPDPLPAAVVAESA
jgi:DHA2 family multidrug resistance protein-like MFS transporter